MQCKDIIIKNSILEQKHEKIFTPEKMFSVDDLNVIFNLCLINKTETTYVSNFILRIT